MYTAISSTPLQCVHDDSNVEEQVSEENYHGIAVLGNDTAEAVSATVEDMVLDNDGEELTVAEPQQESPFQQETQPGSSKPSENVLPRHVPPSGVAIVAGMAII